jgi:predicted TIM-barrel fold metal-dependent hydrolase
VADLGLAGLSLQPSFFGIPIDDRVLYPVCAKAGELGLQVALHTGINYTVTFPIRNDQPIQVDQVACDFPDLVLVACHAGWPWVPEMVAVLRKHPNVYAEFGGRQAGSPGWLRSNTAARMRISEPKVISAYRTVYILNELPMPTRNRTAARKIVIRM